DQPGATTPSGAPRGTAGDARGAEGSGAGADTGPDAEGGVRPPRIDLPPEQRKAEVARHVSRARKAVSSRQRNPEVAIEAAQAALRADETSLDAMVYLALGNYL